MRLGIFMVLALAIVNTAVAKKKYSMEFSLAAKNLKEKCLVYCQVFLRSGPNSFVEQGYTSVTGSLTSSPDWNSKKWKVDWADNDDKAHQFHIYCSRFPTDDFLAGLVLDAQFLFELHNFAVSAKRLASTFHLDGLTTGPYGDLIITHKITSVQDTRSVGSSTSATSPNHITIYYIILFVASLRPFLRI